MLLGNSREKVLDDFHWASLSLGSTPSVGGENHHFSLVWEEQENQKNPIFLILVFQMSAL